ncbi:MAG: protein phosphatase domain protein [Marmoricola sp.]|nr:protein phosphatase domain protein [Marmoricola sp.]
MGQVLRFSGVALSHVGLVRTGNEDSGFVGSHCLVVADGVGGAAAGEVASATAAYVVSARSLAQPTAEPVALLRSAVLLAQAQVAAGVRTDPARAGMATTLTAVATDGSTFALAHVGDSRGYVFREDRLTRVTTDHTLVQRLVDDGHLSEADVRQHPRRNVVMRSVNGDLDEPGDVTLLRLALGDRVLLVSDGLTDLVPEARIENLLARYDDDAAVEALVDAALLAGGTDNVTCLLATVVDGNRPTLDLLVGAARDPRNVVDAAAVRMPRSA